MGTGQTTPGRGEADWQASPVIFAPAQGTFHLFAWALLEEVLPDETISYTFSELRLLDPQPHKSTLNKASDGLPLDEWFIRPYAICQTPDYLREQATATRGDGGSQVPADSTEGRP
jgi:hypothetical protein